MNLKGKKIILGISGSIAAYKTPELVRQLVKSGAEVRVITTIAAEQFVSVLSLSTVSKHPVLNTIHDGSAWNNHVDLGRWADAMLIAPCSANTLAKLASGLCDNLLTAVYLSALCPVFIAPAMDEDMWHHASTQKNVSTVVEYGNKIIPVAHGELASGLIGEGRMAEPASILTFLDNFFQPIQHQPLQNLRALVTAGPTFERLDPVRFIGNFSTGKMGIALAETLAEQGADVTLILGPSSIRPKNNQIKIELVESAAEMYEACVARFEEVDIAVLAAAVADYRPTQIADEKIKKQAETLTLQLEKTKDILATLGSRKTTQTLVGFALETNHELANAEKKLFAKNADLIVLNSLRDEGAGFGFDTNKITLLDKSGQHTTLPLVSKKEAANIIVNRIANMRNEEQTA
ncbi:MAG: bifunctional phosphopantothenoylcysteine decarboxylase/phosphopantothenate--cysteine ligase CoaBC [Bacteroidetes bacterium]|nr:bifunctional phosphopantothenoylcysteine decarboxylase/phosphopantothenate--cysteine ligase CoaBC [Bacteroidota bacterium]